MIVVGLTGGIGSGKSTVAQMLKDEGAYLVDFDYLARLVVEPDKPAWFDIVNYFGTNVLLPDRSLNRQKLGMIIFSGEKNRKVLEKITHPRILAEKNILVEEIRRKDPYSVVVIDAPLLFEFQLKKAFDKVILVYVPRHVQIERVMTRDVLSREDVEKRLNAQMPIEEKRAYADYIISNEGSLKETLKQVQILTHELRRLTRMKEEACRVSNNRTRKISCRRSHI